jgi:predicted ATPase
MNRQDLIDIKISQAEKILKEFRVQEGRLQALTLLALCSLKPGDEWSEAVRSSLTLSNDIMEFVNTHYDADYKPNTRESFRKNALKIFIDANLVELNPDNPSLSPNSSKTHYAITTLAVNTINKFGSSEWEVALDNFLKYREQSSEQLPYFKLKKMTVRGYKSIVEDEIDLGRFNVFIGANGSGKSNVLEILALAGAGRSNDLSFDGLYSRGVRMARPNLILSSFKEGTSKSSIDIVLEYEDKAGLKQVSNSFIPTNPGDIYTKWVDLGEEELIPEVLLKYFKEITEKIPGISGNDLLTEANKLLKERGHQERSFFDEILYEYSVFDLNTKSLRGITPAESKRTPLGLNGEGLDLLIATFTKKERSYLEKAKLFFDWLEDIVTDNDDKLKLAGLKPGRSISTLYFTDHFMQKQNNTFSAENSNEGVLHVLFYLSLFISNKTPRLFAIDNIETALNPRLCQALVVELAELSRKYEKQVLITTHNPAVLDGLNLLDDDQRLFEVYRNDEGHTKTRRIKFKTDLSDKTYKLSEMWMKGLLGAVPENF